MKHGRWQIQSQSQPKRVLIGQHCCRSAASCCVLPFALFFAGISGAWIGNLTAFEPYQPVFITIALACLGYGFYLVYRRPKAAECAEGSYCARPSSHRNAKIGLWVATVLIIIAVGFPYAARLVLDA